LPNEHDTDAFLTLLFASATKKLRLFFAKNDNGSAHRGDAASSVYFFGLKSQSCLQPKDMPAYYMRKHQT
jgi:hypothetical protein